MDEVLDWVYWAIKKNPKTDLIWNMWTKHNIVYYMFLVYHDIIAKRKRHVQVVVFIGMDTSPTNVSFTNTHTTSVWIFCFIFNFVYFLK